MNRPKDPYGNRSFLSLIPPIDPVEHVYVDQLSELLISRMGIDEWTSPKKNILQGGGGGGGKNGFPRQYGKWFQKRRRIIITEST